MRTAVFFGAALAAALVPCDVAAQRRAVDDPRLSAHLALGLGGDADYNTGLAFLDGSVGLDATVGLDRKSVV